jgi:YbbR domain-containing protein
MSEFRPVGQRLAALRRWAAAAAGNAAPALLSLALAVVVWVAVTNSENPQDTRQIEVRVEADRVPAEFDVIQTTPERVTVTLTGPRNTIRDVRADEVEARVDLSGADEENPGQSEFSVSRRVRAELRGRRDRRVRAEAPDLSVRVTLERLERRTLPVKVNQVGVLPVGFELDGPLTVEPLKAQVVGTSRNLRGVEVVSADAKLDGLTVSVSPTVPLEARDSAGRTVGQVTVEPATARVTIPIKQNLFPKQVTVNVDTRGRPRTGFTVTSIRTEPALVTIVGRLDQINAITGVFTDVVDIDGADRDQTRPVRLQLPPGVTSSQQSVVVFIGIQAVRTPGSVAAVPRVVNLGPGLTASLTTPVVALNLSGPLADLTQLRPTDVSVTVDVAGLGPGTHRLEPKVQQLPPTIQLEAVVPDRVEVIISPAR